MVVVVKITTKFNRQWANISFKLCRIGQSKYNGIGCKFHVGCNVVIFHSHISIEHNILHGCVHFPRDIIVGSRKILNLNIADVHFFEESS